MLGFGAALWLLGLTPLPAVPAAASDLLGIARRATAMGHGMPWQSVHLPRVAAWTRAHLPAPRRPPWTGTRGGDREPGDRRAA